MTFLIALVIIIPTLIAVLLFLVAGLSFYHPELLAASTNPTITILCIVAGIIAAIPLLVAMMIGLSNVLKIGKNKEGKGEKK